MVTFARRGWLCDVVCCFVWSPFPGRGHCFSIFLYSRSAFTRLYYHEQKRICTWNFLQKQQTLAVLAEELVDDVWRNSKWDALSGEVSITRITQGDIELPLPPNSLDSHQTWKPKSWTLGLTPRPHFIWRYTNADLKICLKSLSLYRNNLLKIS